MIFFWRFPRSVIIHSVKRIWAFLKFLEHITKLLSRKVALIYTSTRGMWEAHFTVSEADSELADTKDHSGSSIHLRGWTRTTSGELRGRCFLIGSEEWNVSCTLTKKSTKCKMGLRVEKKHSRKTKICSFLLLKGPNCQPLQASERRLHART